MASIRNFCCTSASPWLLLSWLYLFGITPCVLSAQQSDSLEAQRPLLRTVVPDTSGLFFTQPMYPERHVPETDTLPGAAFRFYDPARQFPIDYGTLGNLGSSARPQFFETAYRRGFEVGVHAFDLYQLRAEDLAFYRISRTYSKVFFAQGKTQNDNMLRARVSRTFADNICFALDYRNFNNVGQFRYQTARHNSISAGIWWPIRERYQIFLVYTRNTHQQQENGGIVTDTLFGTGQFSGPITAEVRLPDLAAQTRISDWTALGTQYLDLGKNGKRTFRAAHSIQARREKYKFYDTNLKLDSLYYDTFLVDVRGIRNFIDVFKLENNFEMLTFRNKNPETPSDLLAFGLSHTYFHVQQEPGDSVLNNLFATGRMVLNPSDRFVFKGKAEIGLLSNFGEYHLDGKLELGMGSVGRLQIAVMSQRTPPSLLQHQLFISQRLFWQNDFAKPLETTLSATYSFPWAGLSLSGRSHLVNNYLYFDQQGLAAQTTSPLQVVQLLGNVSIKAGKIHLDNTLALQQANRSDVFRLPKWFSKNSLYYQGQVFKLRMDLRLGFDFRVNNSFRPDGYQPMFWQFVLQDEVEQKPYPWIDGFVSFKVEQFMFFFRYENMAMLANPSKVYYQTARYPQLFNTFRLGIGWRFLDGNIGVPESATGSGSTRPPAGVGN
ncbi:MAG: hypothetical protein IPL65_04500 [Lewinellaceae bacterium]|nr:hypothetical protein [Lewinellaceae bacterium]